MAKNKDKKKTSFKKNGLMSMALAGVMAVSPFMFVGCGEAGPQSIHREQNSSLQDPAVLPTRKVSL